jgi:hypothetical protein
MSDQPPEKPTPPPQIRRINSLRDAKRAATRIGDAALAGVIDAKRANSGLYAVSIAAHCVELETIEKEMREWERTGGPKATETREPPETLEQRLSARLGSGLSGRA